MKKRSYARLFTAAAVLVGSLLGVSKPVSAEDGRVAHIAHTDIGIYFRTDPNNWDSRGSLAGVDGDEVTLRCVIEGMAVGQFENHIWYKADNAKGSGLLPDHYLDTPVKANEYLAGMPRCDESESQQAETQQAKTLFYAPQAEPFGGQAPFADIGLPKDVWFTSGSCSPNRAVPGDLPPTVNTLSGWSVGRIGPVFFLKSASDEQKRRIHRIVLFDPGATSDMEDDSFVKKVGKTILGKSVDRPCDDDVSIDVNGTLASWLSSDPQNQLVIFTGKDTEMKSDDANPASKSNFTALWKHYLAGIWNEPFAQRATICDYSMMEHHEVLREFSGQVRSWNGNCPQGHNLTVWHP